MISDVVGSDAKMAIYELAEDRINPVPESTFVDEHVRERLGLQRLLRANIEVISPDTLVLAEEFGQWEDSRRRIDLLGIDKDASLVVIELKRSDDGGHMDLQAIRYAAMVSNMTFEQAVAAHAEYPDRPNGEKSPEESILSFLEWDKPDEDRFAKEVRIVLAAADFSKELTTAVMWLNNTYGLDIRCVRLKPYSLPPQQQAGAGARLLLDVQQVIPLPEAAEYQVQVREKAQRERNARGSGADRTKYNICVAGESHPDQSKRRAILFVIKALVEKARIPPERISEVTGLKSLWISAEGRVSGNELASQAAKAANADGRSLDPNEWFTGGDDVIYADGKTYALKGNIWNSDRFPMVMDQLKQSFPEQGITCEPVRD